MKDSLDVLIRKAFIKKMEEQEITDTDGIEDLDIPDDQIKSLQSLSALTKKE